METDEAVDRIQDLVGRVIARFGEQDLDEQAWLRAHAPERLGALIGGLSVHALHLLDAVAEAEPANVVGLSAHTGVPKGTVSKTLQRLSEAELVERYRLEGNRKEVHVRLTADGELVHRAHRELHAAMGDGLRLYLRTLSPEDLEVVTRVLGDILRMPREGVRWRPDLLGADEA